ncbi:MAG: hypothetical protein U0174_25720 [Polyangiaceae bacterium]
MNAETLWNMSNEERAEVIRTGVALDPRALVGWNYRGVSLGLPRLVERLTWTTFRKSFHADPEDGERVSGINVRVEQDGVRAPIRPTRRAGKDFTFGPFAIESLPEGGTPFRCGHGLVFDYGKKHGRLHPMGITRDVVVALDDRGDLLLGALYIELGTTRVKTPSFFTLERDTRVAS